MPIPRRALTINFERSITAGLPNVMEVVVNPLSEPGAPELDLSLVGGPQSQTVVLANEANPVVFELVPSDSPELDQRVLYRIGWRERFLGRQYTHDFVMPDTDVAFADLSDLGTVLGGETYVQWTDRGRPGGVAGLNSAGQVIDAEGTPIVGSAGAVSAASFTASGGVRKVATTDGDGDLTYSFQLDPATGAARKWSGPVLPASGNFGTVTHNLGSVQVLIEVRDAVTRLPVGAICRPNLDGNTVAVEFTAPPVSGQYVAVVVG